MCLFCVIQKDAEFFNTISVSLITITISHIEFVVRVVVQSTLQVECSCALQAVLNYIRLIEENERECDSTADISTDISPTNSLDYYEYYRYVHMHVDVDAADTDADTPTPTSMSALLLAAVRSLIVCKGKG